MLGQPQRQGDDGQRRIGEPAGREHRAAHDEEQLPFIGATWLVERLWPAASLLVFLGQVTMLVPLALLGLWYVGLSTAERRRGLDLVRAWRRS
jgi:hypothetical protein